MQPHDLIESNWIWNDWQVLKKSDICLFSLPRSAEQLPFQLSVPPSYHGCHSNCGRHNHQSSWGWHQPWCCSIWMAIGLPTTHIYGCGLLYPDFPWMRDERTMNNCAKVLQFWQLSFTHPDPAYSCPTVWAVLLHPDTFMPSHIDLITCYSSIHHALYILLLGHNEFARFR